MLLLAGLARKLFAPLALTVAVAMIASYVVSIFVTPVAARYVFTEQEPRGIGKRVGAFVDRVADRYSDLLRRALGARWWVIGACAALTVAATWGASRLPMTFFPEIDESMERVYVRFPPGISLEESTARIKAMGRDARQRAPEG